MKESVRCWTTISVLLAIFIAALGELIYRDVAHVLLRLTREF